MNATCRQSINQLMSYKLLTYLSSQIISYQIHLPVLNIELSATIDIPDDAKNEILRLNIIRFGGHSFFALSR